MDWFIFVVLAISFVTSLFSVLDKKTIYRVAILGGLSLLFGASLLTSGISFPTGWTITTSGSVQTIAQTFTTYTSANNPWVLGVGWLLFFTGFYFLIEVWSGLIMNLNLAVKNVREKYGF